MIKYNLSYTLTYIKKYNRIYNWLNGEYVEFDDVSHPFLNIIKNNINNFDKFKYQEVDDDFNWLLENKFIVKEQKEIHDIILNKVIDNNSDKYLQLTLLPVQMACNFACTYCYEDREQKSRMGDTQQDIIFKYIQNIKNLEYLQIEWFGGEPMLNVDFILNFSKVIQEYSNSNNINYRGSMTTNAYYLNKDNFIKLFNNDRWYRRKS